MRISVLFLILFFCFYANTVAAQTAPGSTGYIGIDPSAPPPVTTAPNLPPVFDSAAPSVPSVPVAPVAPVAPTLQGQTAAPMEKDLPPDPCAAYLANYDIYAACQDRVKKMERMQAARDKRVQDAKTRMEKRAQKKQIPASAPVSAPVTPAPAPAASAPAPAATQAAPAAVAAPATP